MSVDGFNLSVKSIISHKQFHNIVEANPQCNPDRRNCFNSRHRLQLTRVHKTRYNKNEEKK